MFTWRCFAVYVTSSRIKKVKNHETGNEFVCFVSISCFARKPARCCQLLSGASGVCFLKIANVFKNDLTWKLIHDKPGRECQI